LEEYGHVSPRERRNVAQVNVRNHNLFGEIHPLYFLTISDNLWNLISRPDPTMNRLLLPTYRELAAHDFLESHCYLTHIIGESEIAPHVDDLVPGMHYSRRHLDMVQAIGHGY
jgi:hypothetical protein